MTNTGADSGRNLNLGSDKEENPGKTTKFCVAGIKNQPSESEPDSTETAF